LGSPEESGDGPPPGKLGPIGGREFCGASEFSTAANSASRREVLETSR
jgi:hypothetical protein